MASLPHPESAPAYPRLEFKDLFHIESWQDSVEWKPFNDGIDFHRLYGDGVSGPTAMLVRFRKEGRIPLHLHPGCEHILVLTGSQRDQNGTVRAGTLMINPPGTAHSVMGEAGCIVLAIYEKPVQFLQAAPEEEAVG